MLLMLALVMPLVCACNNTNSENPNAEVSIPSEISPTRDRLVIGYTGFSLQFNPFYAVTSNDRDVADLTSVHLLTFDRNGSLVENAIDGKTTVYNETDYKYEGISNVDITVNDDGGVTYSFTLREGVKFSDGEILNADDVIFTMYVLADPSYDGPSAFSSLPINGLKDYQSGFSANISGIIKTGEYSFKINMSHYDSSAVSKLDFIVAPLHYYGDAELYNFTNNSFGFAKGNLGFLQEKLSAPFGAGAYVFKAYKDGTVYFERNENYYKGTPVIKYVEFRETAENKMLSGVVNGELDIGSPSYNTDTINNITNINGGSLNGAILSTYVSAHSGYGYIGICADNILVGEDKSSEESKNLRKAFATLFAAYRDSAVNNYYGDAAYVIDYPISATSWASPSTDDDDYKTAYSLDVNGSVIYNDSMTDSEKLASALNATTEYFKAAGFVYDEISGKFTSAPNSASLAYTAMVHADGVGNHPAYEIFINARNALNSMGISLSVNDVTDAEVLWNALDNGECQIWAAAWETASDPDLYQIYHSSNINGINGSTGSNDYGITDETLDELILSARISAEQKYRKSVYADCFDIIFDWGVEIPVYQRLNATVVNSHTVNVETFSADITANWCWLNDIHLLEMNAGY